MTAAELVAHLARDCEQPQDVVRDLLQALADTAETELRAGRPLTVPGLCTLRVGVRLRGEGQPEQIAVHWQSARELVARLGGALNVERGTGNVPQKTLNVERGTLNEKRGKVRPGRRTASLGW